MNHITSNFLRPLRATMIAVTASAMMISSSWAQTSPPSPTPSGMPQVGAPLIDLPRWSQGDVTPQEQYQTLKKEAGAVYQESTYACKTVERSARSTCMKEARATYNQDLQRAKDKMQVADQK